MAVNSKELFSYNNLIHAISGAVVGAFKINFYLFNLLVLL